LWTRTEIPDADDLWSFAVVTDDPPQAHRRGGQARS
jgi:hypothetical protein